MKAVSSWPAELNECNRTKYLKYNPSQILLWHRIIIFFSFFLKGVVSCVNKAGIGFMMAPKYHPAMKIVSAVRKKLKIKTVFNVLGPMLNPARVPFAVVGVFHEDLVSVLSAL